MLQHVTERGIWVGGIWIDRDVRREPVAFDAAPFAVKCERRADRDNQVFTQPHGTGMSAASSCLLPDQLHVRQPLEPEQEILGRGVAEGVYACETVVDRCR